MQKNTTLYEVHFLEISSDVCCEPDVERQTLIRHLLCLPAGSTDLLFIVFCDRCVQLFIGVAKERIRQDFDMLFQRERDEEKTLCAVELITLECFFQSESEMTVYII